jgi:protein-disulfide isomerase
MTPDTKPASPDKNKHAFAPAIVIAAAIIAGTLVGGIRSAGAAQVADSSKVRVDGEPFIGKENAPVTLAYWYDYQCPFCRKDEDNTIPQIIKNYVDTGKVKIVFKDYEFLGQDSRTLGQYSRAVWAIAPDKFYRWHKAIYDSQGRENHWATQDKIMSVTTSVLGVNDAKQVSQIVSAYGDAYQKQIDADHAEGGASGIHATPCMVIGTHVIFGSQPYAAIKLLIDLALAGK